MEYLGEIIALGIDSIILGACIKQYIKHKNAIKMIEEAPALNIDRNMKEIVQNHPNQKLPYATIRGNVKAIGNPMVSNNNPKVTGVVQTLTIKEHVVQRGTTGYWSDQERLIQEVHNTMPFVLHSNNFEVEILDPLTADILDMDVISDTFNPTMPSVMDHIWGFVAGMRQRGVQTTEKMLRTGTLITGIGELVTSKDGKSIKMQPPCNGAPFYLTGMPVSALIRKLDDNKRTYKLLCALFGVIGIVIGSFMFRRYWKERSVKLEEERRKQHLENSRRERRSKVRDANLTDAQLCVVCRINPREIILLPCGHVCLCEDCGIDIDTCPVCRSPIEKKAAAYMV